MSQHFIVDYDGDGCQPSTRSLYHELKCACQADKRREVQASACIT